MIDIVNGSSDHRPSRAGERGRGPPPRGHEPGRAVWHLPPHGPGPRSPARPPGFPTGRENQGLTSRPPRPVRRQAVPPRLRPGPAKHGPVAEGRTRGASVAGPRERTRSGLGPGASFNLNPRSRRQAPQIVCDLYLALHLTHPSPLSWWTNPFLLGLLLVILIQQGSCGLYRPARIHII